MAPIIDWRTPGNPDGPRVTEIERDLVYTDLSLQPRFRRQLVTSTDMLVALSGRFDVSDEDLKKALQVFNRRMKEVYELKRTGAAPTLPPSPEAGS